MNINYAKILTVLISLALISTGVALASEEKGENMPLIIQKSDGLTMAQVGDVITYYITYTNANTEEVEDILIEDRLPEGVIFISATNGGEYENGTVTWDELEALGAGESGSVQVTVELSIEAEGVIENTVTIQAQNTPSSRTLDTTEIEIPYEIPEFPTIALPIALIIAMIFIVQWRKK